MFNLLWVHPNPFFFNLNSCNFIYNATNMFVFYKFVFAMYYTVFLWNLKKTVFRWLFFIYMFCNIADFEIYKYGFTNNGLINSLAFWHPLFLLMLLTFFYKIYFSKITGTYLLLLLTTIFVILGSWWSVQEVLWHGWWNWDGVENTLLILWFLFFWFSHKKINLHQKWYFINYVGIYLYVYFHVFNKTNIFKSIHSFTASLYANLSYYNYIYLNLYCVYMLLKCSKWKNLTIYIIVVWFFFFSYFFLFKTVIFSKTDFFFYLNSFMFLFLFSEFGFFYIILIIVLNGFFTATLIFFVLYLNVWFLRYGRYIHYSFFFISCWFFIIFTKKNFFFLQLNNSNLKDGINFFIINKMVFNFNNYYCNKITNVQEFYHTIFKNINYSASMYYYNLLLVSYVQCFFFFKTIYNAYFFSVTKVFYLKQKPRYNYYNSMYIYKPDLLINQQKYRRVMSRISKYSWITKSVTSNKHAFFFVSNFQTIDLRLYKFLLRKFKKKLLKFNIESYLYLFPNNKTSHKSKNSRMGKGKGLNNRFYFRCKKTRPLIVFLNFNFGRFLKLKYFLLKFFSYKIV